MHDIEMDLSTLLLLHIFTLFPFFTSSRTFCFETLHFGYYTYFLFIMQINGAGPLGMYIISYYFFNILRLMNSY